ncbi:MAG TPA: RrF2 family transcriptional regulator [Patescibacteria group bacterium]|nr:RrF2 family transcriptional regulator [Patescibacteria group bacterium]
MKLSTKGRYAARAMLELAEAYGSGPVKLSRIACRQEISERYLERMMHALVKAELIFSIRGQKGGFQLSNPPSEIRLSTVIQAVEGSLALVACVDSPGICHRHESCVTTDVWERVKLAILDVLDSITLEDMLEMQRRKSAIPRKTIHTKRG